MFSTDVEANLERLTRNVFNFVTCMHVNSSQKVNAPKTHDYCHDIFAAAISDIKVTKMTNCTFIV